MPVLNCKHANAGGLGTLIQMEQEAHDKNVATISAPFALRAALNVVGVSMVAFSVGSGSMASSRREYENENVG